MPSIRFIRQIAFIIAFSISNLSLADEINIFSLLSGADATKIEGNSGTLPPPLAEFIYSKIGTGDLKFHLTREEFTKCYGDPSPDEFWYNLELTNNGINFLIPLTGTYSCGDTIAATFEELAPFMSEQGLMYAKKLSDRRKSNVP